MTGQDSQIDAEARALWQAVSTEPVPQAPASQILEAAMRRAGVADYDRICSPWLRAESMTWASYRIAEE